MKPREGSLHPLILDSPSPRSKWMVDVCGGGGAHTTYLTFLLPDTWQHVHKCCAFPPSPCDSDRISVLFFLSFLFSPLVSSSLVLRANEASARYKLGGRRPKSGFSLSTYTLLHIALTFVCHATRMGGEKEDRRR